MNEPDIRPPGVERDRRVGAAGPMATSRSEIEGGVAAVPSPTSTSRLPVPTTTHDGHNASL